MPGLRIPRAHSNDWYDHLATLQDGYYLPWESDVSPGNGEDAFLQLVESQLSEDKTVLEVGCGHGELALDIAGKAKQVIAYDRVQSYIDLAEANRKEAGADNVSYLCYNAVDPALPELRLPVEDQSIDVVICRRGPHHWLQDVSRACKPGARLIQLSPMEEPIPAWSSKLPKALHYENSGRYSGAGSIHQSIENRLHQAGLTLHSGWSFDVPEVFKTTRDLYQMVSWGLLPDKTPDFEDVEQKLDMIFERYAEPKGIVLRHCRYLWYAEVPSS